MSARKPAAKAAKPRIAKRQPAATPAPIVTAEVGREIGNALGRTLADLMSKESTAAVGNFINLATRPDFDPNSFGDPPVHPHAFAAEQFQFSGPVGEALQRLLSSIEDSAALTVRERAQLAPVLAPEDAKLASSTQPIGPSQWRTVSNLLHDMADRLNMDNHARRGILERLEI